jgi:ATP-dependent Lon protease
MEQIENNIAPIRKNVPEKSEVDQTKPVVQTSNVVASEPAQPQVAELQTCIKEIRENQKGISFKKLFGDYIKGAHTITLVDPFTRLYYQIDNLIEFINVVKEMTSDQTDVKVHLSTQNDEDKIPEMIDIFDELTEELGAAGIEFTYDFEATHDRYIKMDNGWTITLGRGLDIFEKYNKFSLCKVNQEERRCKKSIITFNKD